VQAERSSADACGYSKRRLALAVLLCAIIVSSPKTLLAQTPAASPTPAPRAEPDGVTRGGYQIHSSVELGYRSSDVTGSGDMYDTLVNLQTGPRILDQTLTMQSVDHQGLLFDNLYLNSFAGRQEQMVQPARQFPARPVFLRLRLAGESTESANLHSVDSGAEFAQRI
jgi:hypothetical protein